MKLQLQTLALAVFLLPAHLYADAFLMPGEVAKNELVKEFPQPYIVKKGDTLWDIAEEYFATPEKWLKIWEQNLQVTNPDLIYPGNEIWLKMKPKAKVIKKPERPTVTLEPRIIFKPAERIEKQLDASMLMTALARQDFIRADAVQGAGHILDSEDDRLNYGAHDKVYLALDVKANPGDVFNIFRTGDPIYNYSKDESVPVGVLVNHLGSVEVTSVEDGVYRGTILTAFEEIQRTDRLKRALPQDYNIKLEYPEKVPSGHVMYIRQDAGEAGQGQVIGIDLGSDDGLRSGSVLGVYRAGRKIRDKVYTEETYRALPEEKVGEVIVLVAQEGASIVMISQSSSAINKGDLIQTLLRK